MYEEFATSLGNRENLAVHGAQGKPQGRVGKPREASYFSTSKQESLTAKARAFSNLRVSMKV